jgi:hypothetical protein
MKRMGQGKRAGARQKRRFRPVLVLIALGISLAVVAWGFLVYAAIEFGGEARDGDSEAWYYLAIAAVGATACLFVGLMLIARLLRALGITKKPEPKEPKAKVVPPSEAETDEHAAFRPPSDSAPGRRAAR